MNDKTKKVQIEFFKLTGIALPYKTNRLKDRCIRKDKIFEPLTRKIFDNPFLLKLLLYKARGWGRGTNEKEVNALLGYIYYCAEDFKKAEKYFLKVVNFDPENFDNWHDLAFSLYHQKIEKHELAKKILFNFDACITHFRNKNINLPRLKKYLSII